MTDMHGRAAQLRTVEAWLERQLAAVRAELAATATATAPSAPADSWAVSWTASYLTAEAHTPGCWVPGHGAERRANSC